MGMVSCGSAKEYALTKIKGHDQAVTRSQVWARKILSRLFLDHRKYSGRALLDAIDFAIKY